jgi:shikimate kinase
MTDYYDPHPRIRLGRSVVLAGHIGSGAAAIGRHVCSRTGLPFHEIDRLIEHEAGCSLARLVVERGRDRVERWAEAVLTRLVDHPPYGVIVFENAWPPLRAYQVLRLRSHFVCIQRPTGYLLDRIESEVRRAGDWILEGQSLPVHEEVDLKPLLDRRTPLLCKARIVLDAGEKHVNHVAGVLLESFEEISGAEVL